MMYSEFTKCMNERHGWTFTEDVYTSRIEPVYCEVNEDKAAFVDFCAEKDLNGIETLYAYRQELSMMTRTMGMTIYQAFYMCLRMRAYSSELRRVKESLENERAAKHDALNRLAAIQALTLIP